MVLCCGILKIHLYWIRLTDLVSNVSRSTLTTATLLTVESVSLRSWVGTQEVKTLGLDNHNRGVVLLGQTWFVFEDSSDFFVLICLIRVIFSCCYLLTANELT